MLLAALLTAARSAAEVQMDIKSFSALGFQETANLIEHPVVAESAQEACRLVPSAAAQFPPEKRATSERRSFARRRGGNIRANDLLRHAARSLPTSVAVSEAKPPQPSTLAWSYSQDHVGQGSIL